MIKIITIDGPSGSGKGTVSRILAKQLGFHYLDSGALYRLLGLVAVRHGLDIELKSDLTHVAENMDVRFEALTNGHNRVLLEGEDVPRVAYRGSWCVSFKGSCNSKCEKCIASSTKAVR